MRIGSFLKGGLLIVALLTALNACNHAEATLKEAKEEMPFPVIGPDPLAEEWQMGETHVEDALVITTFRHEEDDSRQIELIQDPTIQGLKIEMVRDFLIAEDQTILQDEAERQMIETSRYVGEVTFETRDDNDVQMTFVQKEDVYQSQTDDIPFYQVAGRDVSVHEMIDFVEDLDVLNS
ncbi:hypothetical protein [Salisediminibacterium halotolerans]|uniref:hypothetical protein n=1 Tax=Salisediminibacterium halotolerans TaxID=517425 RepID=UPI000EAF5AA4|nr:hypothetical protein [Salisediminibacterium halotolerans]RLJ72323.1 hypothetical protein BCL39_2223 [Actinophytocola xinjiangensis]RPE85537.1 hypothetical protein EDD67_2358 [Salisediminibacterium halotolerans]TWG33492.1 hypothetical protein BCL52_2218 [Salisediminibacterium halotolerans]GEL09020.1 hypothetical protein SHA02_24360 [Salisediminibacterium halotolerans]